MAVITRKAISSSGTSHTLLSAPSTSGEHHEILKMVLCLSAQTTALFKSGSTNLSGAMTLQSIIDEPYVYAGKVMPIFVCGADEAFTITTGASVTLAGYIEYTTGLLGAP